MESSEITTLGNTLQHSSRVVYLLRLTDKIRDWHPRQIACEEQFCNRVFEIQQTFCPTHYCTLMLVTCLMAKLKSIENVIRMLQQKFIEECLPINSHSVYK